MTNIYQEITLIIVTYRSEKIIQKKLEILKKFSIIIVDNSNSNKLEKITSSYENIDFIKSTKNLGYGVANNLAVSKATTPFILITNPDILIDEEAISDLYRNFLNDPENIGILGPALYDQKMNRRTNGTISYFDQLNGIKVSKLSNNIPSYNTCCQFLVGCCYLMRRDFFNSLGGFDKNFFMYFEDVDLCDRIKSAGYEIIETPDSFCNHFKESSSNSSLRNMYTTISSFKFSEVYYFSKYGPRYTSRIYLHSFDYLLRILLNLILFNKKKFLSNIFRLIGIFRYLFYKKISKF